MHREQEGGRRGASAAATQTLAGLGADVQRLPPPPARPIQLACISVAADDAVKQRQQHSAQPCAQAALALRLGGAAAAAVFPLSDDLAHGRDKLY